jgi:hypothetical protein
MAQEVNFFMLVTKRVLFCFVIKNVANGLIYSPQLWRTRKYCWTPLV